MMGAGKPEEGYGVRDFKSKVRGKLVEHGRFLCVLNPVLYNIGKIGIKNNKDNKMRILIDIGHPAHVHIFKNFAHEMEKRGHELLFTCRDKEFEIAPLEA